MENSPRGGHRFSITSRQVTLAAGLAVATVALIAAVPVAFGWSYNHGDPGWMEVGLIFFITTIPACGFAAVGVLFGQGVKAALGGLFVGVTLWLILRITLG